MKNIFSKKIFPFEYFAHFLIRKNNRESLNKFLYKNIIEYLQKKHMNIIVFSNEKAKYVSIINPKNNDEIVNIVNKIVSTKSAQKSSINPQIFIHTHGIGGYKYDILNYFSNNDFISSIKDKKICIFTNNCSPLPFDLHLDRQCKASVKRQKKMINSIIEAAIIANSSDKNVNLILSGFSRGCMLNTLILDGIDLSNLEKINQIFLIEESIPQVRYIIEPFAKRYKRLKTVLSKKGISKKVNIILIPSDGNNKTMQKYHPIKLMQDLVVKINNDKEIQKHIRSCQYLEDDNDMEKTSASLSSDSFVKKLSSDGFVKKIKQISDLRIKYCPQKNKFW